jgi:hypothetical protein
LTRRCTCWSPPSYQFSHPSLSPLGGQPVTAAVSLRITASFEPPSWDLLRADHTLLRNHTLFVPSSCEIVFRTDDGMSLREVVPWHSDSCFCSSFPHPCSMPRCLLSPQVERPRAGCNGGSSAAPAGDDPEESFLRRARNPSL